MFEEEAQRRVSLGLIVGEIIKENDIQVDPAKVRAMVEELASTYEEPEQVVEYYYSNRELLAGVESAVLEDQVVEHILDRKSTRLNSSHVAISYAVFCLKKKTARTTMNNTR